MFETSVIHAEVVAEKRFGLLSVSFAGHVLIVISILAAGIRTTEFPRLPPPEYIIPIITPPVSIPPALGTPNGGHKQATPPVVKEKTPIPTANLAPNTMPDHVEPATPSTTTGDPTTTGGPAGSDQTKGVPWGDKNGIGDGPPMANIVPVTPDVPLRIIGDVKAPVVIHRVTPLYPKSAIAIHLNGSAIVECIIDKTGHVRDAKMLRSSSPLFNQAAIDAVLQWQFVPGSLHGTAVDTIFDLTVTFQVTQ
jgi:TonB family protein